MEKIFLCTCNLCGEILEDTNPQTDAKEFEVKTFSPFRKLEDHKCPTCKIDSFLTDYVDEEKVKEVLTINNTRGEIIEALQDAEFSSTVITDEVLNFIRELEF